MDKKSLLTAVKAAMAAAPETAYSPEQNEYMASCRNTIKRLEDLPEDIRTVRRNAAMAGLDETRKAATFLEFPGEGRCTYRIANGKAELKAFAERMEKWTGIKITKLKAGAGTTCPPALPAVAMAKPAAFPAACKAGIEALQKSGICADAKENPKVSIQTPWRVEGYPTSDYDGWLVATDGKRAALLNCGGDMSGTKPVTDADGDPIPRPNVLQVIPDYSQVAGVPFMVMPTIQALALAATMANQRGNYASVKVYATDDGISFSASSAEHGEYLDTDTVGARFLFSCDPHYLHDALALAARCGVSTLTLKHEGENGPFALSAAKFIHVQMPLRS